MATPLADVRFRGQSRHRTDASECLLMTQSGHSSRTSTSAGHLPKTDCHAYDVFGVVLWAWEWNMTRKSIKTSAQETVVAAGKSAAEGTKALAGELAHAAATAAATATAAPGAVWDKVATAIGAKKPSSRTKKKVAKKVASKKRTTPKKKANTKKASRRSAKKKRL